MTKKKMRPKQLLTRQSLVAVGVIIMLAAATGTILYLHNQKIESEIAQRNRVVQEMIEEADAYIKQTQERKATEEKARKEAESKEVAEQARTANGLTAGLIDASKCNVSSVRTDPSQVDVMVNKKHCIQPLTFAPSDLVTSNGATLSAKAINAYNQLFAAAAAAGQPFYVTSSYRSYNDQVNTYNYWVGVSGQAGADTYSARPGYSEHQTGLVFDVAANGCALDCFGSTSQYQWLQRHAANYGFIQRYYAGSESITGYKAEEWHYRYVGVDVAKDMKAKGVKTLEQYWNMPGGLY